MSYLRVICLKPASEILSIQSSLFFHALFVWISRVFRIAGFEEIKALLFGVYGKVVECAVEIHLLGLMYLPISDPPW